MRRTLSPDSPARDDAPCSSRTCSQRRPTPTTRPSRSRSSWRRRPSASDGSCSSSPWPRGDGRTGSARPRHPGSATGAARGRGLLCNDFELPAELPPATLLDLAARHVIRLEEVEPGKTICRLRGTAGNEPLTPYEQRVLDEVRRKAVAGVVPTDTLTTGAEDASRGWHRAFSKEVISDAQGRGLTRDRWPGWLVSLLGVGPFAVGGLLYLASLVGGESNDHPLAAGIAGGVAITAIGLIAVGAGRLSRSTAQLPTEAGREMTARCLALRAHSADEQLADLPPAAVQLWGRHFAYTGVMGVAPTTVACFRSERRTTTARGAGSADGGAACASDIRVAGLRVGASTPGSPPSSPCSGARLPLPRSTASGAWRSRPPTRSRRPARSSTRTSSTGSVVARSC